MIVFKVSDARKEYKLAQEAASEAECGSVMCLSYRTKWVSPSVVAKPGDSAIISVPGSEKIGYVAERVVKVLGISHNDGVLTFTVELTNDRPSDWFLDVNKKYFVTTSVDNDLI